MVYSYVHGYMIETERSFFKMSEQNKLVLALVASIGFFFIMDTLYPSRKPDINPLTQSSHVKKDEQARSSVMGSATDAAGDSVVSAAGKTSQSKDHYSVGSMTREESLARYPRVPVETPLVKGSIRLRGAMIDDLELISYKETTAPDSKNVVLLAPSHTARPYFAAVYYTSTLNPEACPLSSTDWKLEADSPVLTPQTPITLTAKMDGNVEYKRIISIDDRYLITVQDIITNQGKTIINLKPTAAITRIGKPVTGGFFVLHEGGVGVLNHKLSEVSYDDIAKQPIVQDQIVGGWHGFTDKYWLTAVIPDKNQSVSAQFLLKDNDRYQAKTISPNFVFEPGQSHTITHHFYLGAKVLSVLDHYEKENGFDRFDLAVDFGWFYFLTKPLFYVLEFLNELLGNMGVAILVLTVIFKLLVLPLANKSHRSMAKLKTLQPKLEKIKTLYGHDAMRMNQEMMNLYKKENASPMSGCLPMLIQAPIFFCLYKVFFVTIEMRQAPFMGWIHDLSMPDPTTVFNLFGLIPWDPPSFLMLGAWPLLMGATMLLQQKMGPQPADPQQAKIMLIMPVMFTFMFASFPAGLVIYWAWSNILTIAQQWYMNKKVDQEVKPVNGKKKK